MKLKMKRGNDSFEKMQNPNFTNFKETFFQISLF